MRETHSTTMETPTVQEQSQLSRDLDVTRIALRAIAPILYVALQKYLNQHEPAWVDAPPSVKADLILIAERAARSVLPEHRQDAKRQAAEIFRASVHGALRGVLEAAVVLNPSEEHTVRRVLASAEQALLSYTRDDIAGAVIEAYERALRDWPKAGGR